MFCGYIDPGNGFNFFNSAGWLLSILLGLISACLIHLKKIYFLLKKQRKTVIILLSLLFVTGTLLFGALLLNSRSAFNKRVIILGIDGLSPDIIEPMMVNGQLSNFARLKNTGSYQRLATTNPPASPVAWAAFATGKNPGENGIYDFIIRDPKTYGLDLSLARVGNDKISKTVKTKSFWYYTSRAKIPTVIIGCPMTFPPDKIYGRMLSGMGVPDILGTEGTFIFFTSEPENKKKDAGGKVFNVPRSKTITLHLIGPRTSSALEKTENARVPVKASIGNNELQLDWQSNKIRLRPGHWSDWQEVTFDITPFKKAKGIFKFYLVSLEPEFKLYVSPIQFDPRKPLFPISYPPGYAKELADTIGLFHTQGMPVDTWAINEGRLQEEQLIQKCEETTRERKAILDLELSRLKKGVLFCYFGGTDTIQHMFWRYIDPQHPLYDPKAPQEYKDMIKTWYIKIDSLLGEVMQKITDKDTLIVLSDHGFNTFRRAVHINSWLRANGYLALKNNLAEGAPLLADVDWPKTRAYSVGFGAIYLNIKGREGKGIVDPKDAKKLKMEIAARLKEWRDEKYGELASASVIHEVYKNEDIFKGPFAKDAPDLYVGFNIGYRASWQTALGAVPAALIEDNLKKWSGDHLFDPHLVPGVFFSSRQMGKKPLSLYDITPLISALDTKTTNR